MATQNLFDLLDDDAEDPSLVIAAAEHKKLEKPKKAPGSPKKAQSQPDKSAKLPSKPLPPAQAVREARNESGRGGGRGGGRGRGYGGRGFNRDSNAGDNSNAFSGGYRPSEEGEERKQSERRGGYGGPRGSFHGGRRGGFNAEESGERERQRGMYDRYSGTGRGNEFKRDGAGRGNWGSPTDEVAPEREDNIQENEKNIGIEKQPGEEDAVDASKENTANEAEEKEPENKEMTLEEYEKILEEKRKALLALKTSEQRKGSEKDKRKDADKEEKAKKSVSINEFLKPAEGERYYGPGRGRGRGRGGPRGGYGGNAISNVSAPSIEDPGHFPSLGGK
ncbi:hypothetical protein F3Y22_tig00013960pilonHSYRG00204 [Hibiscus syriacus]|uniref:Hyaluronan/mRNA-binding protein domain-containing protein n=1 Tax=Hibiscus syriacus TaxID=106335 RepID=A0A6A3C0P5_HIBSY|nr:hypothetical protein F3Y22_tig00013960pilonHSYRG00204 [Hibiscus syriacus]